MEIQEVLLAHKGKVFRKGVGLVEYTAPEAQPGWVSTAHVSCRSLPNAAVRMHGIRHLLHACRQAKGPKLSHSVCMP